MNLAQRFLPAATLAVGMVISGCAQQNLQSESSNQNTPVLKEPQNPVINVPPEVARAIIQQNDDLIESMKSSAIYLALINGSINENGPSPSRCHLLTDIVTHHKKVISLFFSSLDSLKAIGALNPTQEGKVRDSVAGIIQVNAGDTVKAEGACKQKLGL